MQGIETDLSRIPQSKETELMLLASIVVDGGEMFDDVSLLITKDDFYFDAHRRLWDCITELRRDNQQSGLPELYISLQSKGWFKDVGGEAWFKELIDTTSLYAPTSANAVMYARAVREYSTRRQYLRSASELIQLATGKCPVQEIMSFASQRFTDLEDSSVGEAYWPIRVAIEEELDRIDKHATGQIKQTIIATPFNSLNGQIGGWQTGLYVVGARPGTGKSAFMKVCARTSAQEGHPSLFFSMEMKRRQLAQRYLSMESGVNLSRFRSREPISAAEAANIMPAARELMGLPVFFNDVEEMTVGEMTSIVRKAKRKENVSIVFIDYLQLICPENRSWSEHEQLRQICRDLKIMSMKFDLPIVALAQLNREVERRDDKKPKLSDLRGSGSIEQDADDVYFLYQPDSSPDADEVIVRLFIAKQRNGPPGGEVEFTFRRSCTRLDDRSFSHSPL